MNELRSAVDAEYGVIDTIIKSVKDLKVVGEVQYRKVMQTLYASLYVYAPQGRIGGIEALKIL